MKNFFFQKLLIIYKIEENDSRKPGNRTEGSDDKTATGASILVSDQHQLQCASLMFDMLNGTAPDIYNYYYDMNNQSVNYSLRLHTNNRLRLASSSFSSAQATRSFPSLARSYWNEIPLSIKQSNTKKRFKKDLKAHILQKYTEKCLCFNPLCRDMKYHQN